MEQDQTQFAERVATFVPPELLLAALGVAALAMVAAGAWGWRESARQVSLGLALSFAGAAPLVAILAALHGDLGLLAAAGGVLLLAGVCFLFARLAADALDDAPAPRDLL